MVFINIFEYIFYGSVGGGGGGEMGLVMFQIFASLAFELMFMFSLFKQNKITAISVSLLPCAIIFVYTLIMTITFSSFLTKKQDERILRLITEQMLTMDFLYAVLLLSLLFLTALVIYIKISKARIWESVITFSLETLTVIAFAILYGGLFIEGFRFTIVELVEVDIQLIRFFLYGVAMVILKTFSTFTAIAVSAIVKDRSYKNKEEIYSENCFDKKVQRFLSKNMLAIGISLIVTYLCFTGAFLYLGTLTGNVEDVTYLLFTQGISLFFLILAAYYLKRKICVKTTKAYKVLANCENREEIFSLFCDEIIDANYTMQRVGGNQRRYVSPHFTYELKGLIPNVSVRELDR